jgi:hypothetical protein
MQDGASGSSLRDIRLRQVDLTTAPQLGMKDYIPGICTAPLGCLSVGNGGSSNGAE